MVTVRWKIGPRPQGRWRTPLEFFIEIKEDKRYADYRPQFRISKEYKLPGKVYMGCSSSIKKDGYEPCRIRDYLIVSVDEYLDEGSIRVNPFKKGFSCNDCGRDEDCELYLECRQKPDYSDFEQVFRQIATDLIEAWNKSIEDALSYEECKAKEETVTSETTATIFEKAEQKEIPARKVRL